MANYSFLYYLRISTNSRRYEWDAMFRVVVYRGEVFYLVDYSGNE